MTLHCSRRQGMREQKQNRQSRGRESPNSDSRLAASGWWLTAHSWLRITRSLAVSRYWLRYGRRTAAPTSAAVGSGSGCGSASALWLRVATQPAPSFARCCADAVHFLCQAQSLPLSKFLLLANVPQLRLSLAPIQHRLITSSLRLFFA